MTVRIRSKLPVSNRGSGSLPPTRLAATDTANMGNLPWKEVFRDPKLQALIEEGLANNVDMQAAILRVEEAKLLLTSARLSFLPSFESGSARNHNQNGKYGVCESLYLAGGS